MAYCSDEISIVAAERERPCTTATDPATMENPSDSRRQPLIVAAFTLSVTLAMPCVAMAAGTSLGIDAEYGHDTNVNRAAISKEELSEGL